MSADFLTELQAEIGEARERPPEDRHTMAVHELAERFGFPADEMKDLLTAQAPQPTVTRELLLRRFVEAWLAQQREEYGTREHGGHDG